MKFLILLQYRLPTLCGKRNFHQADQIKPKPLYTNAWLYRANNNPHNVHHNIPIKYKAVLSTEVLNLFVVAEGGDGSQSEL